MRLWFIYMTRPSIHQTLMEVAKVMSQRSTCSRAQVGAVIARDTRIVESGYNGSPAGLEHCNHACTCPDYWDDSEHSVECKSLEPCELSTHAEANAIAVAAKHGTRTDGTTMYVTLSPCINCAKLIINAGIAAVVYDRIYRETSGLDLLKLAKVETVAVQALV